MELKELLELIGVKELIGLTTLLLTIIEITPLKINPWSTLAKTIGKALNVEIINLIEKTEADNLRYRILRFDDEIRHKVRHTEEHYNQIIDDIDKYDSYCSRHKSYPNTKANAAIKNIKNTYLKCKTENNFFV